MLEEVKKEYRALTCPLIAEWYRQLTASRIWSRIPPWPAWWVWSWDMVGASVSGFIWLFSSGAVMEEEAAKLLGVKMCKFIPKHTRTLGNEFRCYVNYDSGLDRELWTQLVIQCSKGPMWHFPLFIFLVDWKATASPPPSQTGAPPA